MPTVRFTLDPDNPPEQRAVLDAMTDEEITAAALSDPDNPLLTDEEIERAHLALYVRRVRVDLGMTQKSFAERFGIPAATLQQWETARRTPDRTSLSYLRVIASMPEQVATALHAA